jgi:hypothetical protein
VNRLQVSNVRLRKLIGSLQDRIDAFAVQVRSPARSIGRSSSPSLTLRPRSTTTRSQNDRLRDNVDSLESTSKSMATAAAIGLSNNAGMELLIAKNSEILAMTLAAQHKTQQNVDAAAVQNLISLVLSMDADQSGTFCEDELALICERMRSLYPTFSEAAFLRMLRRPAGGKAIAKGDPVTLNRMMRVVESMLEKGNDAIIRQPESQQ